MHKLWLLILPNKVNHITKGIQLKNIVFLCVQMKLRPIFSSSFPFIQQAEVSKDCSARSKVKSNTFRSFLLQRHQNSLSRTFFFFLSLYLNSWREFPFLWGIISCETSQALGNVTHGPVCLNLILRFKMRILFGITCLSQYLNGLRREVFSGIILHRCLVGYSKPFYVHLFGNNYYLPYTVLQVLFPIGDIKGK